MRSGFFKCIGCGIYDHTDHVKYDPLHPLCTICSGFEWHGLFEPKKELPDDCLDINELGTTSSGELDLD